METNTAIFTWFHHFAHTSAILDAVIRFAADPLGIVLVVLVSWYIFKHHTHIHGLWELAAFFGIAFLSAGIAFGIKEFFPTLRPTDYIFPLEPLITAPGAAFPSMHTAFYSALGGAMFVAHPRSGFSVILLALIIGTARVMAGVHWPFDILFGALIGISLGYITMKLCYQWMCRIMKVCII